MRGARPVTGDNGGVEDLDVAGYYDGVVATLLTSGDVVGAVNAFAAPARVADSAALPGLLWMAWDRVVAAAGGADDTGRQRLVALVAGVKDLGVVAADIPEGRVFTDLPILGASDPARSPYSAQLRTRPSGKAKSMSLPREVLPGRRRNSIDGRHRFGWLCGRLPRRGQRSSPESCSRACPGAIS